MSARCPFFGRVVQDGLVVAKVSAPTREQMLAELSHYAMVYSQDGPIILETRPSKSHWRRHIP